MMCKSLYDSYKKMCISKNINYESYDEWSEKYAPKHNRKVVNFNVKVALDQQSKIAEELHKAYR